MANSTWFDATKYLENKLAQLQAIDPDGKQNGDKAWDADSLTAAMEAAGFKGEEGAYQHFMAYGMDENISPNEAFDVKFYLQSKADALNAVKFEGKTWDAVSVMDAIKAAGMNSAWEHYQLYGSQEGIATSATFDSEDYFIAKVAQMNATKEDGRSNWGLDEVKGIFAEQGLTALEHYNLYGKDENVAKYGEFTADAPKASADGFDQYTGAQLYTLEKAIEAHTDGSIAATYELSDIADAGTITVAEYNGIADLIAGAANAAEDKLNIAGVTTYVIDDSVANIASNGSIVNGADSYNISDTFSHIADANKVLLTGAGDVNATISGGETIKASVLTAAADTAAINIDYADGVKSAEITIDGKGTTALTLDLSSNIFAVKDLNEDGIEIGNDKDAGISFKVNVIGSDVADTITASEFGGVITGGKGADVMTAGDGIDTFAFKLGDSGKPTDANFDEIKSFGTTTGTQDKIDFDIALKAETASDAAVAGKAQLGADGKATFEATDSSVAQMIAAVASALADQDAGSVAWFIESGNTYVFVSDGATGVTDNDVLIKLTGTSASAGTFSADGDLTFSA